MTIAYHSGEDRIVKAAFSQAETGGCECPPGLPCACGAVPSGRLVTRGARKPRRRGSGAQPPRRERQDARARAYRGGPGHRCVMAVSTVTPSARRAHSGRAEFKTTSGSAAVTATARNSIATSERPAQTVAPDLERPGEIYMSSGRRPSAPAFGGTARPHRTRSRSRESACGGRSTGSSDRRSGEVDQSPGRGRGCTDQEVRPRAESCAGRGAFCSSRSSARGRDDRSFGRKRHSGGQPRPDDGVCPDESHPFDEIEDHEHAVPRRTVRQATLERSRSRKASAEEEQALTESGQSFGPADPRDATRGPDRVCRARNPARPDPRNFPGAATARLPPGR